MFILWVTDWIKWGCCHVCVCTRTDKMYFTSNKFKLNSDSLVLFIIFVYNNTIMLTRLIVEHWKCSDSTKKQTVLNKSQKTEMNSKIRSLTVRLKHSSQLMVHFLLPLRPAVLPVVVLTFILCSVGLLPTHKLHSLSLWPPNKLVQIRLLLSDVTMLPELKY